MVNLLVCPICMHKSQNPCAGKETEPVEWSLPLFLLVTGRGVKAKPRRQLLKHALMCHLWLFLNLLLLHFLLSALNPLSRTNRLHSSVHLLSVASPYFIPRCSGGCSDCQEMLLRRIGRNCSGREGAGKPCCGQLGAIPLGTWSCGWPMRVQFATCLWEHHKNDVWTRWTDISACN